MISESLKNYIRESYRFGNSVDSIVKELIGVGWQYQDILKAMNELGISVSTKTDSKINTPLINNQTNNFKSNNINRNSVVANIKKPEKSYRKILAFLSLLVIILAGSNIYFWQNQINLQNTNNKKIQDFYTNLTESKISFNNAGNIVFPDEQKFIDKKTEYIKDKKNFIEVNLRTMKLAIYENGEITNVLNVLSKGKENSWWETPTGDYTVLSKSSNIFSSIGHVWMPYSVQFYGNYFIHGWPYFNDGTPVSKEYSGGCIRLATEDAKIVFDFAQVKTPILVLEDKEDKKFGKLEISPKNIPVPLPTSKSFMIYDLSTDKIILEKNSNEKLPIASLTKLMTAIVAHEIIYLGRSISVAESDVNDKQPGNYFKPIPGNTYIGIDLLYPLLVQSSNDVANVLSSVFGKSNFVRNMNIKANSLNMNNSNFADASGISSENIGTAIDLAKLAQYIYFKRPFVFDITRGEIFENVGFIKVGETIDIKSLGNFNEFVKEKNLIGSKNGETTAAKQTLLTVWEINTPNGQVPIAIVILGSEQRERDTLMLLEWLKTNYKLT